MRLFLAINLPAEIRAQVHAATVELRESAPGLSWVAEHRLHFTLKFFGEQSSEGLAAIRTTVAQLALEHREFGMVLQGVSAFPNFRRVRIVWMGVDHEPRLELLHHDIEVACERIGFALEGRPFRPHLTLARARTPLAEGGVRPLRRAAGRTDFRAEFSVRSIELMQSDLSTAGRAYTALMSASLRSG